MWKYNISLATKALTVCKCFKEDFICTAYKWKTKTKTLKYAFSNLDLVAQHVVLALHEDLRLETRLCE